MKTSKVIFRQEALGEQQRRKFRPAKPQPFLRAEGTGTT